MRPRRREWPVLWLSLYVILAVTSWQLRVARIAEFHFVDLVLIDTLACALIYRYFAHVGSGVPPAR